ncbi:MAG TPA: hypothetical protein ENJ95_14370 [Bacteroidetes bacterium]|nr:hypothetical protein [Bacteroidota bacterium]
MGRNDKIIKILNSAFETQFEQLNNTSFKQTIIDEYKNLDETLFLNARTDMSSSQLKKQSQESLKLIENDEELVCKIDQLHNEVLKIDKKRFKEELKADLINSFQIASEKVNENKTKHKLGILFLEHDSDFKACFGGFGKGGYNFPIPKIPQHIEFDFPKELFNGIGQIDYTSGLAPFLDLEKEIGEEKLDVIISELLLSEYYFQLQELFVINTYKLLHETFGELRMEKEKIGINMEKEVFVFGNEHDCGARCIYLF